MYLNKLTLIKNSFVTVKIILLISLIIAGKSNSFSQDGYSHISTYLLDDKSVGDVINTITTDKRGTLLLGVPGGILIFDGVSIDKVLIAGEILKLVTDSITDHIYCGGHGIFGIIKKQKNGTFLFEDWSLSYDFSDGIKQIIIINNQVIFYSDTKIIVCEKESGKVVYEHTTEGNNGFQGLLMYQGNLFVKQKGKGFLKFEQENLILDPDLLLPDQEKIFFCINTPETIVGTSENKLYRVVEHKFVEIMLEGANYLTSNLLLYGVVIAEDQIALSTVTGGSIIVNSKTGKTINIINYQTGLPDDEIFSTYYDKNQGLWLAHEFGISRINLLLPIHNYSNYPGLEGNLLSVVKSNNKIYVSTSEGVFYLDAVKNYKELEVLINEKKAEKEDRKPEYDVVLSENKNSDKEIQPELQEIEISRKEKRALRKDKRAKKREEKSNEDVEESEEVEKVEKEVETTKPEKPERNNLVKNSDDQNKTKTIYALESIKFLFRKIEGLDDKCKQLVEYENKIYVVANTGLYEIKENSVRTILKNSYVNSVVGSNHGQRLLIATKTGLLSLNLKNGTWTIENEFKNIKDEVVSILEKSKYHLILGGNGLVWDLLLDENYTVKTDTKIDIYQQTNYSAVQVRKLFGSIFLFTDKGVFNYDEINKTVNYNHKISETYSKNIKYICSQPFVTWVWNNGKWLYKGRDQQKTDFEVTLLSLFENITNIYVDNKDELWIIDGSNELYLIGSQEIPTEERSLEIYFDKVTNHNSGENYDINNVILEFSESSVIIRMSSPYYTSFKGVKFQYKIDDLMNEWSEWVFDNKISFPFIPFGKHILRIRAKNIFGVISREKSITLKIKPPFYRTWWFYGIVLTGFIGFTYLIIRARERNLKRQQRALEHKIEIRTKQLTLEKEKSDSLLLNILPKETADELKKNGKSTIRYYNLTSVLFTDFKGFTHLSEKLSPVALVKELEKCFLGFDNIIEKYDIEKIKTIGDAYMCVGGIPKRNQTNPIQAVLTGLEICDFMEELKAEKKGEEFWELRLGIHTGPLIAGVIGKKKFAYDVWGDTVNTASRMESSGELGKVNISGTTYNLVEKYFICTHRGMVEAKNKGKIDMYFVDRIKPEYALDEFGRKPNNLFLDLIKSSD